MTKHMHTTHGLVPLLLSLVVSTATAQTVTDSAGVRIVMNTAPLRTAASAWRLAPTPTVDIGKLDGTPQYELHNVMGAVRLSNGTIVVANMSTSELRYYDATGKFVKAAGRQGEGPAEFRQLMGVVRIDGDTVIASDSRFGWEVFSANGTFVRSVQTAQTAGVYASLWLGDGSAIGERMSRRSPVPRDASRWTDSGTYELIDAQGTARGTVVSLPLWEQTRVAGRAMRVEFGPTPAKATDGKRLFSAFGNEYSIRVMSRTGKLEQVIRRAWTPHTITKAERDAYVEAYTNPAREDLEPGMTPTGIRALRLKNLETMTLSPTLPAFAGMTVDRAGNTWVREPLISDYFARGGWTYVADVPTKWSVFDPAGRWLCDLTMPPRFRAMSIDAQTVTGLYLDADDVEHVRVYQIIKPGSR
jgi:hypothetical protein